MQNYTKFKQYSIDSFKLSIPFEKCEIIRTDLVETLMLVNSSGEVLESDFKRNSLKVVESGMKTGYAIIERHSLKTHEIERFVQILITAKLLKADYLNGLHRENWKFLYLQLQNHKIVKFSMMAMLRATCTDIDFKFDYVQEMEQYKQQIKLLTEWAIPTTKRDCGYYHFTAANNEGLEFSKRETISYLAKPYLKIYHKGNELKHRSKEFSQAFLMDLMTTDKHIKDLIRVECTVKNGTHWKALTGRYSSFAHVLNTNEDIIESIFKNHFKRHITRRETRERTEHLTGKDLIIYTLYNKLKFVGACEQDMFSMVEAIFEQANRRSEFKSYFREKIFKAKNKVVHLDFILDNLNRWLPMDLKIG